jgi:cytoskeleton protein RodZ
VGETLKRERVRTGLSLEEISAATRISQRFLKAIEAEDFGALPGLVFARNFVRQYAAYLHLDPAPVLAMMPQVDVESAPMPRPPDRAREPLWDPRWNSTVASLTWTLLAIAAAAGAYVYFNRTQVRPVSAQTAPPPAAPAPVTVQSVSAPASAPVPETAPTPESHPPELHPAEVHPAEVHPPQAHAVEVAVVAKEDSWVSASADGKVLFATILKAGENRAVSADRVVKIRTGNAGGITVTLNGKTLDNLGPSGQIRTLTMTAEGLQAPPPVPRKDKPETPPQPEKPEIPPPHGYAL